MALISERVNTRTLSKITDLLIKEGVGYSVDSHEAEYLHVATAAPEAYDYPGTTISLGFTTDEKERHVAVQKERQSYQFGRYSSGLHPYRIIGD